MVVPVSTGDSEQVQLARTLVTLIGVTEGVTQGLHLSIVCAHLGILKIHSGPSEIHNLMGGL